MWWILGLVLVFFATNAVWFYMQYAEKHSKIVRIQNEEKGSDSYPLMLVNLFVQCEIALSFLIVSATGLTCTLAAILITMLASIPT